MQLSEQAARRGYFLLKKVNAAIREYEMIRDGDDTFTWTHGQIAEHLRRQWLAAPIGCH